MKVLLVVPQIRFDSIPHHFQFWAAILRAIGEKKGASVGILDVNAVRMEFENNQIRDQIIEEEIRREDWVLIGIGGLTSTYKRIKELTKIIKNHFYYH